MFCIARYDPYTKVKFGKKHVSGLLSSPLAHTVQIHRKFGSFRDENSNFHK